MSENKKPAAIQLFGEDAPPAGVPVKWLRGEEEHVLLVRAVPHSVRDRIITRVTARIKAKRFGEQSVAEQGDLGEAITREVAAYALVDTETPFPVVTGSAALLEKLATALGPEVQVAPNVEIPLRGRWTPAVKEAVFRLMPDLAAFVDTAALKLAGIERNQEVDLGKG